VRERGPRKRVVITGMGSVNPLGCGVETVWKELLAGHSGVGYVESFNATTYPSRIGGECRSFDREGLIARHPGLEHAGRNMLYMTGAAEEAVADAGLEPGSLKNPERVGVYMGAGEGEQDFFHYVSMMCDSTRDGEIDKKEFLRTGLERLHPLVELLQEPNMAPGYVAAWLGAMGPNGNTLTACAASSQAIGETTEIIRRGDADVMLSGGAHSMIHPFGMGGFCLLTALSTNNEKPQEASCPFDVRRGGFVLSEGAGVVVLEELEHAKARGARIHAEIIGYGSTADAFRITDSHETGRGAAAAIRAAIEDAGIRPEEVNYINAHGTSTQVNDRVETMAVKQVFGDQASKIPMSSCKGTMGHLIAAAGVTELMMCVKAIHEGVIPPTLNYREMDPDCDLDYVANEARKHRVDVAMKNSFGFGGQNISLIIRRYTGR